jgi:hypothetical protein
MHCSYCFCCFSFPSRGPPPPQIAHSTLEILGADALDKFPLVKAHHAAIVALPGVRGARIKRVWLVGRSHSPACALRCQIAAYLASPLRAPQLDEACACCCVWRPPRVASSHAVLPRTHTQPSRSSRRFTSSNDEMAWMQAADSETGWAVRALVNGLFVAAAQRYQPLSRPAGHK